jgi:hypothetical protein
LFASILCLVLLTADATLLLSRSRGAESLKLPRIYQPVKRLSTNNFARFVFFAGLGGTGHHGWQTTMKQSGACTLHPDIDTSIRGLWYGSDDEADVFYHQLVMQLRNVTQHHVGTNVSQLYCLNVLSGVSMLSYPDRNSQLHHPDLVSLTNAAADAEADLRVVVMHRDPAPMLVSLSLHRNLLELAEEAQQMANQAAILHSQLASIDPQYFLCVPFAGTVARADQISDFVVGGLGKSIAEEIREHYLEKKDDVEAAQLQITDHSKHIATKIKTLDAFHGLILQSCFPRTPEVAD